MKYQLSKLIQHAGRTALAVLFVAAFAEAAPSHGPKLNPVKWTLSSQSAAFAPGSTIVLHLQAEIAEGYHLYSLTTPPGGPIPTAISFGGQAGLNNIRFFQATPKRHQDTALNVPVETFTGTVDFPVEALLAKNSQSGVFNVVAKVRYQACSDEICLPAVVRTAAAPLAIDTKLNVTKAIVPSNYHLIGSADKAAQETSRKMESSMMELDFRFLLLAFGFGVAAIFTPCVFPSVPLTISYFLNQQKSTRQAAVVQSLLFSAGIVVLFSMAGVVVTLIAGPFGVVQLASNPWVNGIIALVFFSLGLSLLGAFELTLPSSLLTRFDGLSQQGGVLGGLMLGFTFCLTSFACVGPFLGTLLAGSVQGSLWQPIVGMTAFATGLATPFFLLSLFPAFLNRIPRSGAWLSHVKVVFGFVILAVALKYVASVDQVLQIHLLTRERFVSLWFTIFLMAALYLLGQLRFAHAPERLEISLGRLVGGVVVLAFAVSLLPALWGGRLGELEALIPLADPTSSSLAGASPKELGPVWLKNAYARARMRAQREHKPLLVAFSGYACTNCHWMKANIFQRPEIASALEKYVLVELYTDGTDAASTQNQSLEERQFSTVALPYYAILDSQEKEVAHQAGLTRDPQRFLSFLSTRS